MALARPCPKSSVYRVVQSIASISATVKDLSAVVGGGGVVTTGSGVTGAGGSTGAGDGVLGTTSSDMTGVGGVGGETGSLEVNERASISATVLVSDPAGGVDVTMGAGVG